MNRGEVWNLDTVSSSRIQAVIISAAGVNIPGGGITVVTLGDPRIVPDNVLNVPVSAVGLVARCWDVRTIPTKRFTELTGTCTLAEVEAIDHALRAYLEL